MTYQSDPAPRYAPAWRAWHRPGRRRPWAVVVEGESEDEAWAALLRLRLAGDVQVCEGGRDLNREARWR